MTLPSPTLPPDETEIDIDSEPITLPPLPALSDNRWHCAQCGSLGLLDADDLCRHCWRESVVTFSEVAARAVHGEGLKLRRRWGIG